MAVHDGHRDRMRNRIITNGIESLQDHEILEYMLYSSIPRKDTNEIAHTLIKTFGSLANVFDANVERLAQVDGMTANAALALATQSGIFRAYSKSKVSDKPQLKNPREVNEYIKAKISTLTREETHLLCKNNVGKIINDAVIAKGGINQCLVSVRDIVDTALRNNAISVVLAHNHPSQVCCASADDIELTKRVVVALAMTSIKLDDHIIVAGDEIFSLRKEGYFDALDSGIFKASLANGAIKDIRF